MIRPDTSADSPAHPGPSNVGQKSLHTAFSLKARYLLWDAPYRIPVPIPDLINVRLPPQRISPGGRREKTSVGACGQGEKPAHGFRCRQQ